MADTPAPMGRGAGYSDFARRNQEYRAKVDAHRTDTRASQPTEKPKPKPKADDSYMSLVPDVAANAAQQAYQEARVQQQGNRLYESRSLSLPFKSEYHQSFGNRLGDVLTGTAQLASGHITGLDKYQEALGNNVGPDYGTQAQYLPEQFSKQNTEIAVARALGVDPSLIKKPNLLFAAATKDMKAHDIQRLATYADFADAYNTMFATSDGFVNAAKTMTDRINELPSQVPSRVAGEAINFTAGLIADAWHPVDNFMTKLLPKGSGDSEGRAAVSSLGVVPGAMVSWDQIKSGFGTAFNAVFDVQHTVRALHDIRATQDDAAYYSALGSIVGLTVALTFAGDGLGKLLLRGSGKALTEALVSRGISTEGLNLAGLTRLAERAGRSKADKKAWADASSEFISKIPAESQGSVVKALAELGYEGAVPGAAKTDTVGGITAYSREGGLGLTAAEREALSESGLPAKLGEEELPTDVSNRLGGLIGRGLKYQPESKWGGRAYNVTVKAPMLPFKHPEVPLNFNLAAQVLFNTNGLGMGDHWKDSWERTADGKTYVDPHTKRPVSMGREVAEFVAGGRPGDWWYNAVSGPLDLFTQFALDPTMAIFKALPAAFHAPALRSRTDVYNRLATDKGAQAMADAIVRINLKSETFRATKMAEVRKSLEASIAPRRKALKSIGASEEVIARATSSSKWRPTDAMIEAIVRAQNNEADSYADLLRLMPSISRPIEGADEATDFIAKLTTARSRDDVADILGDMASANAMSDPYRLPSYSQFTRFKDYMYGKNRQAIADGDLSMLGKTQKTLARGATSLKPVYYQDARQFSNKLGRVGDPASLDLMRRVFLAAGRPPGEVDLLINKLARSTNTLEWQTIYKNFVTDQFAVESQSFLEDMVAKGKFSNYEAATLRNTLLNPFKSVIEQLSNTAGGGSSAGAYTGAKANFVVSQAAPFESDMLATAGLLGSHEHYFALPDYNAWDKFKSDIEKGLSSDAPDGLRSLIFQEGSRITAKPFDDRIAALTSRSNELARQASPYKKQLREVRSEIKTKREMTTPVLKSAENVHNIAKTALKEKTQELKTLKTELGKAEKQFKKRLPKGDEDAVAGLLALREQANNKILVDDAKAAYDAKAAEVETFKGKVSEAKQNLDNTKISIEEGEAPLTGKAEELKLKDDSFTSQTDALKREIQTLNLERAAAVQERMGDFKGFSLNGESRMDPKRAIYNMHDSVRHWFIDKYFRQAVLATGSFSMRVASAEAIASMFRLGAREYSKAWLANHVAEGIAKASGVGAKEITEAEHKVVMGMVHDVLTALHFPEGKQAVKGSVNSFLSGLAEGLGMDDFVQLLSRDIIERGGTLWGINASHGAMDSVSNAMHNLASGYGTGNWESRNTLDNDSLSGLTKSLNDTAKFEPSRQTAEILDRNLDPAFKSENSLAKTKTDDVYGRLETAREENRAALRRTVARDPKKYESILRSGAFINASTHDRLVKEVMQELGVDNMQSPMARNMLLIKQKNVNTVDEWADALFEHVLWLSHGRGKTTDMFESSNINDKIFHRNVLKMLAEGKAPYTPELTRDLYITPDLEQSRVMARQNMKRKPGTEKSSYHSHLYSKDGASFKDLKNLSDEEIAHFKLPPRRLASDEELTPTFEGMTGDAVYKSIIAANTPLKTGFQNKFAGKNKNSVSRMYEDIHGESTSRFPANIPTQVPLPSSRAAGLESIFAATVDRGASWVHDTISTPVINTLAREPLYAVEFAQQMNSLKPLVKDGTLPLEVAMNTARVRAIEHAIKFVHNPQDRFVFEQWARAFSPFWFAKNQALRRAGRLAIENPLGFERYLRTMMAMQNYGAASANNSDNNGAILMPGSMFGGRIMSDFLKTIGLAPAGGVPIGLRGSTSSLASVFPWTDPSGENPGNAISLAESLRPDFGPMISLPIRALSMAYPYSHGMQKLNDEALGPLGSQSSLFQQLVPNSLVRSVISMGLSAVHSRSSITASIDALQNGLMGQYYETKHHELSKSAREQAVFDWGLSHDENYTKQNPNEYKSYVDALTNAYVNEGIWYDGKEIQKPIGYYFTDPTERQYTIDRTHTAAIALYAGRTALSFFSPLALSVTEVNPEMRQLVRDAQATGGDFTKAEALYNNHPEAIYYVAHGTAAQTGIPLPATLDMSKFQNANADLFRKGGNASGLIAFVPYSDKGNEFDSNEYHTQLSAGLRRSLTPPEFLDKMAAAVGNNYVYNYLPKMNEKFENGNTESLRRAKSLYARANPLWTKTLDDSKASRVNALDQVRALLEIPGLDKREGFKVTAPKIRTILKNYDEFTQRYKNADSGWHNYLETQWEEWLKEYANKHKEITLGANSIFKGLKLSDNTGK